MHGMNSGYPHREWKVMALSRARHAHARRRALFACTSPQSITQTQSSHIAKQASLGKFQR